MRMFAEASVRLSRPEDSLHIPRARVLFSIMQTIQPGLAVKHWERKDPDGVVYVLDEIHGAKYISITTSESILESSVCYSGIIAYAQSDTASYGWIAPYDPPPGTVIGSFPQAPEDWGHYTAFNRRQAAPVIQIERNEEVVRYQGSNTYGVSAAGFSSREFYLTEGGIHYTWNMEKVLPIYISHRYFSQGTTPILQRCGRNYLTAPYNIIGCLELREELYVITEDSSTLRIYKAPFAGKSTLESGGLAPGDLEYLGAFDAPSFEGEQCQFVGVAAASLTTGRFAVILFSSPYTVGYVEGVITPAGGLSFSVKMETSIDTVFYTDTLTTLETYNVTHNVSNTYGNLGECPSHFQGISTTSVSNSTEFERSLRTSVRGKSSLAKYVAVDYIGDKLTIASVRSTTPGGSGYDITTLSSSFSYTNTIACGEQPVRASENSSYLEQRIIGGGGTNNSDTLSWSTGAPLSLLTINSSSLTTYTRTSPYSSTSPGTKTSTGTSINRSKRPIRQDIRNKSLVTFESINGQEQINSTTPSESRSLYRGPPGYPTSHSITESYSDPIWTGFQLIPEEVTEGSGPGNASETGVSSFPKSNITNLVPISVIHPTFISGLAVLTDVVGEVLVQHKEKEIDYYSAYGGIKITDFLIDRYGYTGDVSMVYGFI